MKLTLTMALILEQFEKAFDEAQSDNHDIEYATNQVIEYYNEKYPYLKNEFESIILRSEINYVHSHHNNK
jgi:AAA+ ATPase superfamily predicted ATPase